LLRPPSGITLRKLEIEDAPYINEIWPHRSEGSVKFVENLIDYNISIGACDNNGKLVAWCLRWVCFQLHKAIRLHITFSSCRLPMGSLGVLQVRETHKRLGLGSLMVRYMSKKISERKRKFWPL